MLIAPIFHNNYLTPKRADSQQRLSETSLNNSVRSNDGNTSGTYSILKSAFNRGTELLKSTFFTTPLATCSPQQQQQQQQHPAKLTTNGHNQDSPITISSRSTSSSSSSSSSESESEDDRSSPDSIKTELMLFKPIAREPRTVSANAQLIRVPSIRSTSSNSSVNIHSPCPSPFSIPLTPCRQSAFSFVKIQSTPPKKNKRKYSKPSPEKKSDDQVPKRQKKIVEKVEIANKRQTRKSEAVAVVPVLLPISKKTENVRETRSKRYSESIIAAKPTKEFKSPPKKPAKRNSIVAKPSATALDDRRVTRSMKN